MIKLPVCPHIASAGEVSSAADLGHLPGQSDFPEFTGNGWEESIHSHSMHPPAIADLELGGFNTSICLN